MAYATPEAVLLRYDSRRVGALCSDTGSQVTASALLTDPVLAELLEDASGMIDSALLRGGRYTQSDLVALTGMDAKLLQRLVCDIAYGLLVSRRGYTAQELQANAPGYVSALAMLDRLAAGEAVFNVEENVLAGKPKRVVLSKNRQLISGASRLYGDLTLRPGNPGDPTYTD
jgi:phage gp36-like protein